MSCPNGYICLNKINGIFVLAFILIVLYFVNRDFYGKLYSKVDSLEKENNNRILTILEKQKISPLSEQLQIQPQIQPQIQTQPIINQPTRLPGLPINIETRESDGDFRVVGTLYKENVSTEDNQSGNNTSTVILPLYAKRTYRASNRWYYYTSANEHINVRISLEKNGKDCMDDGCEEINDGDIITIKEYNGTFRFKKNFNDKPKYIPFI